jgi:uncharacterized protein YjdB
VLPVLHLSLVTGTTNIIYTLPGGCTATLPSTVNVQPAAITGTGVLFVCATTPLSDVTAGGTWSSSNSAIATVSGTGGVTGVGAGNVTISYTMPSGCFSTFAMTINTNPGTITGTPVVCVGNTTTLSNAVAGGTWTSSNVTQATVGASTGIVFGVAAGTPTITYTYPGGCTSTLTVTVSPVPNVYSVIGGGAYCSGGSGQHIGLSNGDAGINYQLRQRNSAIR